MMHILALCGSLRAQSRSMALLEAMRLLAPDDCCFEIFPSLAELPLFNPDLETNPPPAVHALWSAVSRADAMVIASPEYAHGVTGTIKNALDWLVAYIPFANMPVAALNPSHRAEHADAALKEILTTMNAQLIDAACLRIPVTANRLAAAKLADDATCQALIVRALSAVRETAPASNGIRTPSHL